MRATRAQTSPTTTQNARDAAANFSSTSNFRADALSSCARTAPLTFACTLDRKFPRCYCAHFAPHICNITRACACTLGETRQPKRRSMVMVRCHTDGTKAVRKQRRQKKRKALRACKRSKHGTSGGSRASRLCATIRQHKGSARGLEHCT